MFSFNIMKMRKIAVLEFRNRVGKGLSLKSILGLLKSLKIRAQVFALRYIDRGM
jgi:hypothetical protein